MQTVGWYEPRICNWSWAQTDYHEKWNHEDFILMRPFEKSFHSFEPLGIGNWAENEFQKPNSWKLSNANESDLSHF